MANVTKTCAKCGKQFLIIEPEQAFLHERGLPLPINCPACRQERRLALRGGRQLYRTTCQQCGKQMVVAYDPQNVKNTILCKEDYEKYYLEHDSIMIDPLPE